MVPRLFHGDVNIRRVRHDTEQFIQGRRRYLYDMRILITVFVYLYGSTVVASKPVGDRSVAGYLARVRTLPTPEPLRGSSVGILLRSLWILAFRLARMLYHRFVMLRGLLALFRLILTSQSPLILGGSNFRNVFGMLFRSSLVRRIQIFVYIVVIIIRRCAWCVFVLYVSNLC